MKKTCPVCAGYNRSWCGEWQLAGRLQPPTQWVRPPHTTHMIVKYGQTGWKVITQRAHGIVAAQIAFAWRPADRPARWVETLLAIAEHDDAENELDGERLITDTGGPLNFDMKNFELPHGKKLSSLTVAKSRYIALLTSMHTSFLYEKDKGSVPGAEAFLKEQHRLQQRWRKELGLTKEDATSAYALLEWCDALSLLICKDEGQPEQRGVDISTGPDGKMYTLFQVDDNTLTVQPWPFERSAFGVNFEYRTIGQLTFASSAEFREAFLAAEVEEKVWTLQKVKPVRKKGAKPK